MKMKKYFIGMAVLGLVFMAAPATTQAAGLTQTQIQAVLALLQAFGAEPAVIENAGKAMGLTTASTGSTEPVAPTVVGPKFSVKSVTASTFASTTTSKVSYCTSAEYSSGVCVGTRIGTQISITRTDTTTLGVYTLTLEVKAGDNDVSIPKTTTDSTQGFTGVVYSLAGQDFRGSQSSTFACPTSGNNNCRIPAGQTKLVKVTVKLDPAESGNYGVSFDKLNYGKESNAQSWRINSKSEIVYVK